MFVVLAGVSLHKEPGTILQVIFTISHGETPKERGFSLNKNLLPENNEELTILSLPLPLSPSLSLTLSVSLYLYLSISLSISLSLYLSNILQSKNGLKPIVDLLLCSSLRSSWSELLCLFLLLLLLLSFLLSPHIRGSHCIVFCELLCCFFEQNYLNAISK